MISFRRMLPEDADAVAEVEKLCFATPWSRESFWRDASSSDTYYLVALDESADNKIIGYVGCWILAYEGSITNVAIAPDYRRKGIGRKMLLKLIEEVKLRGVTALTLEARISNMAAIKLYEGLGFKSVGQRPKYYSNPVEAAEIMWNTNI
ncbi:MAG: ribosomal protein S18-alanine N-acetyltransferase [Anaerovibrio sp.]|uniref:ribosomal protein S18-alanine N-acetyltransferase n=1 Tax=Anaerovibrio sp. TaxID=1872532 RepID=UPI0025D967A4|nr:ribosomal protein S18-alanine N-acetyltransferase [Anaerovibrio sp.]MCR5176692.1 ribosomal protein S18-alanine N-acetyltransferase [Anaerovibrio sp.]